MDGFDNAFGASNPTEVDPAAEFLAQEQEDLGGLGEDLGFSAPPVQNVDAAVVNGADTLDFLAEPEPVIEAQVEEEEEIKVSVDAGETVNPFSMQFEESAGMTESAGMDQMTTEVKSMRISEEPECIKQWKIEQEEKLRIKDEAEEKSKEELKLQARKELDDWYKHYNEQLEKTKVTNRNNQDTYSSEVNDIQPGTEWERVAKHCDFNAKNAKNTKDVSRMRGIMLQLKQNPPTRD